ncbi:N-6 DNA methylase [Nocardia sp. NPDC004168]|uniref:HsdM family class I SAM-dependent methyltransferase n=1 Tax=Nocardia sp. NPDC004168 TaxID=3154452 RepID=UPI0033BB7B43
MEGIVEMDEPSGVGGWVFAAENELAELVDEVRGYRNSLGSRGMSTLEFLEQFSYLLFMKLAAEDRDAGLSGQPHHAARLWDTLRGRRGDDLERQYRHVLGELAKSSGTSGAVYARAQNRIGDPALLERLIVDLVGGHDWYPKGTRILGGLFEDFLQKSVGENLEAGNFLTPRPLIQAIVDVMQPRSDDVIVDPACGSAGFLIAAHQYIARRLAMISKDELERLSAGTIRGMEIKDRRACLAVMNMLLHGIGRVNGDALVTVEDVLEDKPSAYASLVLLDPPFGRRSRDPGNDGADELEGKAYQRDDFVTTTKSTHLNLVQHAMTLLDRGGRAAVIVPDNLLYQTGAGEKIRRRLLQNFDVHTLLRLPAGIFYKQGVKANVLFFDKKSPHADGSPVTTEIWVYDFRTGQHFTGRNKPLQRSDLDDFVMQFKPGVDRSERKKSSRFRPISHKELVARHKVNFDIAWPIDDYDDADVRLAPGVVAREIADELLAAHDEFMAIADALEIVE